MKNNVLDHVNRLKNKDHRIISINGQKAFKQIPTHFHDLKKKFNKKGSMKKSTANRLNGGRLDTFPLKSYKNVHSSNSTAYEKDYTPWASGVYLWNARMVQNMKINECTTLTEWKKKTPMIIPIEGRCLTKFDTLSG